MNRGLLAQYIIGALLCILFAWFFDVLIAPSPALPQVAVTNCIANVSAQGTSDVITSAQLPCGTTTTLVLLTASAANTTTSPTYQPIGSPVLPITRADGRPILAGDIPGSGALSELSGNGSAWLLLNPATSAGTLTPSYSLDLVGTFGAACNGIADDTAAITAWLAAANANVRLTAPGGQCNFSSALTVASADDVTISGAGPGATTLMYTGGATSINALTVGTTITGGCSGKNWLIENLRFMSNTVMTGGDGVLINSLCDSDLVNVVVGGDLGGNSNWYNALHWNGGNTVRLRGGNLRGSNRGMLINGTLANQFTDPFLFHTEISHSAVGLEIAGNVGGFQSTDVDILLNTNQNILISQSQTALANKQIFLNPGTASDVTISGPGIEVSDAGSGNSVLTMTGTWVASAAAQCVLIDSGAAWDVTWTGGRLLNCHPSSGMHGMFENQSLSAWINIAGVRVTVAAATGPDFYNVAGAHPLNVGAVEIPSSNPAGIITGASNGMFTVDGSRTVMSSASANVLINAEATHSTVIGAGGTSSNVALWAEDGVVIPGAGDASTAGGTYDIGSTGFPFRAGHFSGAMTAGSYFAGATAGVSCSGSPTVSFASVNGIVTHC